MKTLRRYGDILFVFILLLAVSSVLSVSSSSISTLFTRNATNAPLESLQDAFTKEQQRLLTQAKVLAGSDSLMSALTSSDLLSISSIVAEAKQDRSLDGVLVSDKNGVALSRATYSTKRGDYIYDLNEWGQAVATGADVASFEKAIPPLTMLAGTRIMRDDVMEGAVFTFRDVSSAYATTLRDTFLPHGSEMLFYSADGTIMGSTFADGDVTSVIASLICADSSRLATCTAAAPTVEIAGNLYTLRTIPLYSGAGTLIGGTLVFIPSDPAVTAIAVATFGAFIFFIVSSLSVYYRPRRIQKERMNALLALLALLLFLAIFAVYYFQLLRTSTPLERSPYAIYNSTMQLSPEYNIVSDTFEQQIAITVNSGGEAINAVQAVLTYDPTAVSVVGILTDKSLCDKNLFIEKSIDAATGVVRISCIAPNPGFTEQHGTVAVLQVQPLHSGTFVLRFTDESMVLANDGLGTDVLRKTTNGSYHVDTTSDDPTAHTDLTIFSSTHPNSERWYANPVVKADWRRNEQSTYRYAFTTQADYAINSNDETATTEPLTLTATEDGVYYLYVQETDENLITANDRYTIKIDTTPPPPPTVELSEKNVHTGSIVRVKLENEDSPESYQPGFFIQVDDGILLPVLSPVYLPFIAAGDYTITVRTFDTAGNTSDTIHTVHVNSR